jgi:hypothetical protein
MGQRRGNKPNPASTRRHRKPEDSATKRRNGTLTSSGFPRAHWWARGMSGIQGPRQLPGQRSDGHTMCSDKDCWKTPHHNPRSQYGNPLRRDTGLRISPFTTHFTTFFFFMYNYIYPFIISRLHLCHIILTSVSDNILVYFSRRSCRIMGINRSHSNGLEPGYWSNSPLVGSGRFNSNQIKTITIKLPCCIMCCASCV